jgi:hypothetical protein
MPNIWANFGILIACAVQMPSLKRTAATHDGAVCIITAPSHAFWYDHPPSKCISALATALLTTRPTPALLAGWTPTWSARTTAHQLSDVSASSSCNTLSHILTTSPSAWYAARSASTRDVIRSIATSTVAVSLPAAACDASFEYDCIARNS